MHESVDLEAWSEGQVRSKMWLCEELEKLQPHYIQTPTIWILGGWYGLAAFFLLVRQRMPVERIVSFDVDPEITHVAEHINQAWLRSPCKFQAFTADVNTLSYGKDCPEALENPDVVLNTSCEHMMDTAWFDSIPAGTLLALQSTNLDHPDHHFKASSIEQLQSQFPLEVPLFAGDLRVQKESQEHDRFMVIGIK